MIHYVKGDATYPIGEGNKVICHVCNDIGKWGSGFVMAISKKWKQPEKSYRDWSNGRFSNQNFPFKLGQVQFVQVGMRPDIFVANMVAQRSIWNDSLGTPPIRYEAVRTCLKEVAGWAPPYKVTVHMPRIGCGLAGGVWEEIEPIIQEELKNLEVYVYDFER